MLRPFFCYVDDLVSREKDDVRLYALQDANWNVVALCDIDGAILERYTYDAFGTRTALMNSGIDFDRGFTGQVLDDESGLMLYRNRYYSTSLGRFLTRDPIGYAAGDANLYRYVLNNPSLFVDPSGRILPFAVAVGILVLGGGSGVGAAHYGAYEMGQAANTGDLQRFNRGTSYHSGGVGLTVNSIALVVAPSARAAPATSPTIAYAQAGMNISRSGMIAGTTTYITSYSVGATHQQSMDSAVHSAGWAMFFASVSEGFTIYGNHFSGPAREAGDSQLRQGYQRDWWANTRLSSDDKLYGGIPGRTQFFADRNTLDASGHHRATYWQSLQVKPHDDLWHRPTIQEYSVGFDNTPAATGRALNNTVVNGTFLGEGGGIQYFVPANHEKYILPSGPQYPLIAPCPPTR